MSSFPAVGVAMAEPSSVCRALVLRQSERLPREFFFRPDEPSYEGMQEAFWACAAVVARGLLGERGRPDHVLVGRAAVPLPVPPKAWDELHAELALDDPRVRAAAAAVLAAFLLREHTAPPRHPLAECAPPHATGFLLLACHLFAVGRETPPVYGLDFRALRGVARRAPLPDLVGDCDEVFAGREFARYSGLRAHWDAPLKIPHHAFYRRLAEWLAARPRDSGSGPPETGFILRGLREAEERPPAPAWEPLAPTWEPLDDEVYGELNRLRTENDALRGVSVSSALAEVLAPVLSLRQNPREAAERPAPRSELAERLVQAVLRFLRHPEVELYGAPGEVVRGEVPSPEYQPDPAGGHRGRPSGYRVSRRGVRLNGIVVVPALVIPTSERRP